MLFYVLHRKFFKMQSNWSSWGPEFVDNGSNFGKWIHPVLSISQRGPCCCPHTSTHGGRWHSLTEMQRHSLHAGLRTKLPGAKCAWKDPSSLSCLRSVNTFVAVQQLPGLSLMTIKHWHEKVDKGWNSRGGLATKRLFYSVQSGRDTEREGRRRGWEESGINELKVSWNSGRLNSFGFI